MILELVEEKSVTSVSVMVDAVDSGQEKQLERLAQLSKDSLVSVGLHLWFQNTNFSEEVVRQFEKFVSIFGFEPSHLDIHKMDHLKDGYLAIQEFCVERGIPCKNLSMFGEDVMINKSTLFTTKSSVFDATGKTFFEIELWLQSLEDDFSVINFHPGYYDPKSKSSLNKERETDGENIRKIISHLSRYNLVLANFNDLKRSFS